MTNSQPRNLVKIVNEDHKHCLMSGIRELWNSNCYYDATMVGRYQHGFSSVSVNKSVLAAVSHKFACLLTNAEDDVNIIFPDTDIQILKSFANFVYSGQIILNAECSNLAFELQSFFSEWDIQCSQTTCDKCYTSTSECEGVSKSKNLSCSKPQHSPLGYEQTVSQETIDQATDLNKFSHRTYTRKKKLYKPLVRLEVIPELSMATREPIDLAIDLATISNIVETKTITYDFSNGTSMEVHEEATETLLDEINCNFVNAENLKEEEKRNKELLSLLGTLTEKTTRYRLYVKHILGSDKKSTPAEVPKPKHLPCKTCGKAIQRDYMATHEKIHLGERPYLCELCGATFTLADRLRRHLKFTHHDKSQLPLHTCKICGKSFKKSSYLKRHETLHSGVKPYKCPYCDKSFRLLPVLQKHKRTHTGEKPYECEVCHKRFSARTNYVVHLRKHREMPGISNGSDETNCSGPQSTLQKCNICGTTFHRYYSYLTHMAAHNGEDPKLPCRLCPETFTTYKLMKNHLREKHADALFMCDRCPSFFTTQTALKNHKASHKEGKLQRCLICVRSFPTKEALEAHKKNFHTNDSPLTCNVCGKAFKSVLTLRIHGRVHRDERPYQCSYCPKAFRQDTHLLNHTRTHTGEKPFVCTVCHKAFTMKNNLQVHMKIHTGKKIQCEQCGKVFRSIVKLKEHEGTHTIDDGESCSTTPA